MADQNQNFNTEDVEAKRVADAAAEAARVAAEEKRKADEAAAEAAKQKEIEDNLDPEPETVYVSVVLDPEFAAECDCDKATVGTANGEYVLTSTASDVPQSDVENVLASPAAKVQD